jgi:hypothetical protein
MLRGPAPSRIRVRYRTLFADMDASRALDSLIPGTAAEYSRTDGLN